MSDFADDAINAGIEGGSFYNRYRRPMPMPMRTIAPKGSDLAKLRIEAHKSLDVHWHFGDMSRSEAYARLSLEMGLPASQCHIGMFGEQQCRRVIELCTRWADA